MEYVIFDSNVFYKITGIDSKNDFVFDERIDYVKLKEVCQNRKCIINTTVAYELFISNINKTNNMEKILNVINDMDIQLFNNSSMQLYEPPVYKNKQDNRFEIPKDKIIDMIKTKAYTESVYGLIFLNIILFTITKYIVEECKSEENKEILLFTHEKYLEALCDKTFIYIQELEKRLNKAYEKSSKYAIKEFNDFFNDRLYSNIDYFIDLLKQINMNNSKNTKIVDYKKANLGNLKKNKSNILKILSIANKAGLEKSLNISINELNLSSNNFTKLSNIQKEYVFFLLKQKINNANYPKKFCKNDIADMIIVSTLDSHPQAKFISFDGNIKDFLNSRNYAEVINIEK